MQNPFEQFESDLSEIKGKLDLILEKRKQEPLSSKYLTTDEVMDALRIKHSKLQKLMREKKIPFARRDRRIYFKRSDVEAYMSDDGIVRNDHTR